MTLPFFKGVRKLRKTVVIYGWPQIILFISIVFEQEGKKHSLLLEEQRQSGGLLGGGLRYPKDQLLIFWVQCEQPILEQRCDKRVDQMIAQGLLGEMQLFHEVWLFSSAPGHCLWLDCDSSCVHIIHFDKTLSGDNSWTMCLVFHTNWQLEEVQINWIE